MSTLFLKRSCNGDRYRLQCFAETELKGMFAFPIAFIQTQKMLIFVFNFTLTVSFHCSPGYFFKYQASMLSPATRKTGSVWRTFSQMLTSVNLNCLTSGTT